MRSLPSPNITGTFAKRNELGPHRLLAPGTFTLMLFAALVFARFTSFADIFTDQPLRGIVFSSETRTNPPQRLFVAQINLANPHVHVHVSPGGPDPDGEGKWQTTLMQPTKIAGREKFNFVVNGDFFTAKGVNDGEGTNSHFRAEQWATVAGPAVTDGKTWSAGTNARPCLVIKKNHQATIEMLVHPGKRDWEVIGGNVMLVSNGKLVTHPTINARHPRTVVGLNATRKKLTVLVVDGRKPGVANGMTYDELGIEMLRLGCTEALNLDGGGSSVMAVRDKDGAFKILNEPTDGHERAVANVLGISVGH